MARASAFSSLKELIKAVKENYIELGPEMDDFVEELNENLNKLKK